MLAIYNFLLANSIALLAIVIGVVVLAVCVQLVVAVNTRRIDRVFCGYLAEPSPSSDAVTKEYIDGQTTVRVGADAPAQVWSRPRRGQ